MFGKKDKKREINVTVGNILTRGVEEVFPNKEHVQKILESKKITLYLGIDPTGPTLHLGHAIALKKLQEFQSLGHKVILLIGDFTGMIGDPTDKSATRKKLSKEEVLKNSSLYKKQASTFLDFTGANKAELKYNSSWLSKMSFVDVLELASHMTVDQMLKRDMFEKRMSSSKPIFIHEFLYPLLQGYDSVAMDVDGEIGGNDQMFNMLTGRTLLKQMKDKDKFVLTTKLLTDASGKKMGKTEGNMVTLLDDHIEMFGKIMSWTDGMIIPGFELCTYVSLSDVENIQEKLDNGENPKNSKVNLAKKIVSLYHGDEKAKLAYENFENTFSKGGVSEDALEIRIDKETLLVEILLNNKILSSKNEFRRLIDSGSISDIESKEKINNPDMKISKNIDLKIGKRRFVKIKIN